MQNNSSNQPVVQSKFSLLDKEKWLALINEWEKCDESQKAFCQRLQLNLHTFSYMRSRLLARKKKSIANKFIPLKLKDNEEVSPQRLAHYFTLESNQGIKLHIPFDINEEKLLILLRLTGWPHA